MIRENIIINLIHFFYKKILFQIKNWKNIKIKKNNKNLVIFGAGLTINELTKKNHNYFEKYFDIATISYGAFAPKKINFMFYEFPDPTRYHKLFYKNFIINVLPELKKIMRKSSTKKVIIKNMFDKNILINFNSKKIYNIFNWDIKTDNLKKIFQIYAILNYFKLTKKNIIQKIGSIIGIVIWALENDYKKVILAGVDLNNYTYFFEKNTKFKKKNFLSVEKYDNSNTLSYNLHSTAVNNLHPTAVVRGNLDILDIFRELNNKYKSRIYITSKNSKLSKIFPIFKYDF
jgi:hypothetical protein